ncbi:protein-associating with the carboxyl-terminal domain of ezrin [Eurosta solidaginis]|uniref:protein-associating with the carboxyl-terminal domain of ezrin n=1 Tax=Eurosta solidaginis TaxID=178769 RepID=UPI0035312DC8
MGNDSSRLKGLVIDKNSVEANDFWTLYNAESPTTSNEDGRQLLSIFQGETVVNGQLWATQGPLERAIKNLMIYRHPYILKYVTTWEQSGQKHLATERVRPLADLLSTQNSLQACLGLRTILCSLIFLVEKALGRHLNVCISSVYVTSDGSWRLAGFEYVWKHKDLTKSLIELAQTHRYAAAIDTSPTNYNNIDSIEQYAFATLCEEVLNKCSKSDTIETPHAEEFRDYCAIHLKHSNTQLRPRLSAVLLHPYFNHEFVLIHSFLFELPLKSLLEKQDFFTGLIDRLRYFSEDVVGAQLAADLLSRMVLLDPTAQLCVTPYVLKPKTDHSAALFCNQTYIRYVMPHIKKMFRLRDAQIRLILLEYFMEFVRLLTKDELLECILPYLLEGMNDTNDVLVAKTLRCLADLVPILGASTVIAGNRTRIFSDGRPQAAVSDATTHWVEPRSITPVMGGHNVEYMVSDSPLSDHVGLSGSFNSLPQIQTIHEPLDMPPRLSPDGGEDDKSIVGITDGIGTENSQEQPIITEANITNTLEKPVSNGIIAEEGVADIDVKLHTFTDVCLTNTENSEISNAKSLHDEDENEQWSDWESDELQKLNNPTVAELANASAMENIVNSPHNQFNSTLPASSDEVAKLLTKSRKNYSKTPAASVQHMRTPKINDDLNAFDIVVQKTVIKSKTNNTSEFDFFKDMEPVIVARTSKLTNTDGIEDIIIDSSRFAAVALNTDDSCAGGEGWGMDDDAADVWKE